MAQKEKAKKPVGHPKDEKSKKEEKKEIIYTIPLREAFKTPKTRRARKAVNVVRDFLIRHTKTENIKIDASLNEALWERGIQKPPRRVKVKAIKEEGRVTAMLAE